ncbi:hypothetical protein F4778DRAFT_782373 [Xylariomycetidae sp. FL2044]|nr:hypothetical protein F4778DRAFT_782373 [Xylariomycetidae sp. FL2044]
MAVLLELIDQYMDWVKENEAPKNLAILQELPHYELSDVEDCNPEPAVQEENLPASNFSLRWILLRSQLPLYLIGILCSIMLIPAVAYIIQGWARTPNND